MIGVPILVKKMTEWLTYFNVVVFADAVSACLGYNTIFIISYALTE